MKVFPEMDKGLIWLEHDRKKGALFDYRGEWTDLAGFISKTLRARLQDFFGAVVYSFAVRTVKWTEFDPRKSPIKTS